MVGANEALAELVEQLVAEARAEPRRSLIAQLLDDDDVEVVFCDAGLAEVLLHQAGLRAEPARSMITA